MPSPASPSDTASAASPATLVSSAPITPPTRSYAPLADLRDDSHSESDDDDSDDDGFEAAHAAFLARRIAEAAAESSAAAGGMSPFDESVIDHEWDELVKSMKAIVPTVAHFVGSSLGPTVFAMVCTWLGFKFHRVVLDRV